MLSAIMLSVVAPLAWLTLTFLPKTFLKLCSYLFQNIQIYSKFIGFYPLFSISATNLKLSGSNFMQILQFFIIKFTQFLFKPAKTHAWY
jgi:hypothetical protein